MRFFATSDLHLDQQKNLVEFKKIHHTLDRKGEDCLLLVGDICETEQQLLEILDYLRPLYKTLIWTAGNHELWLRPSIRDSYQGSEQRYFNLVEICRQYDVHTPEDPFVNLVDGEGQVYTVADLFVLYDYTFKPEHVLKSEVLNWAEAAGIMCNDEYLIKPEPYKDIVAWCEQRVTYSEKRLNEIPASNNIIFANHFAFKEQSFSLPRIPQFSIWCGSKRTENWHQQYPAKAMISGHLHLNGRQVFDEVPFYEVSLGYPGQWDSSRGIHELFTEIFPDLSFELV